MGWRERVRVVWPAEHALYIPLLLLRRGRPFLHVPSSEFVLKFRTLYGTPNTQQPLMHSQPSIKAQGLWVGTLPYVSVESACRYLQGWTCPHLGPEGYRGLLRYVYSAYTNFCK